MIINNQFGNLMIAYTHGPGVDEPVAMSINGSTYFYIPDIQGSIRAIIDTDGNLMASYTYDVWGNLISYNGTIAQQNDYLYTGREYDWQSGIYYYRARYYNPELGRFLSQDPAGMVDGPNMYVYVKNEPVNGADPWGMDTCDECIQYIGLPIALSLAGILYYVDVGIILTLAITGASWFATSLYENARSICSGLGYCPYYSIHASYGEIISAGVVLTVGVPFVPPYTGSGGVGGGGRLGIRHMGFTGEILPYIGAKPSPLPIAPIGSPLWRWTV